jgi:hypothetical protein
MLRAAAVSGLLGAAVLHASVVDEHLRARWLAGLVVLALQLVETALVFALVANPSVVVYRTAIAVSLAAVALSAVSRTTGPAELVTSALEVATALVVVQLLRARWPGSMRTSELLRTAAAVAVVAIVVLDYVGNRAAATAFTVAQPAARGHVHGGGPLRPGEYPLGEPLRKPTEARGAGFYFGAWPLRRVVLELGVGPDTMGVNSFDVIVVDYAGHRIEVPDVRVTARLAGSDLSPLRFRAGRLSPGHFVVDVARLPTAGNWFVRVDGRRRARGGPLFEHTFAVRVGKAGVASRGNA